MATNLYEYYTGQGQALPSMSQRSGLYSSYGLGGGYSGSSAQNAALLSKLQGGSSGTAPSTTGGGYSQAPTGSPQPISNDPGIDDLTSLAGRQATDLRGYNDTLANGIRTAYQDASGSVSSGGTGLTDAGLAMQKIQNALTGSQNGQAAVVPQTVEAARGSFANNDQVTAQAATSNIPYAEQVARLSANLVPAENAYTAAQQATQARLQQVNAAAQLQAAGFSQAQQLELNALQQKVARGQALTDMEFQRESQLQQSKIQADATIKAAQASAGGQIGAANINSQASLNSMAASMGYPSYAALQQALGNGGSVLDQFKTTSSNPQSGSGTAYDPNLLNGIISKYK